MAKLKIAIVTPGSYPIPSAGSSSVERVVEKMVPLTAHAVEPVIYGRSAKGLGPVGQIGGVSCYRYPAVDKSAYVKQVSMSVRKHAPDLIEVENRPGYVLALGKNHPGARIWLNLHSSSFIGTGTISRERLRASFQRAEKIIVNSEFLRDEVIRRVPEAAPKLRVVHIGVETERFLSRWELEGTLQRERLRLQRGWAGRDVILFMGRLIPLKGVHHLLNVMPRIIQEHPQTLLVVVGSPFYGSHRSTSYSRMLLRMGESYRRHIQFVPYVPYTEVPDWFLAADVAAVPSGAREAFGLVNVEAMSCGIPVVASRAGGIKEIVVDGETGYLVDPERLEMELGDRLLQLLKDPSLREELGRRARERVEEQFTWQAAAERWLKLLEE
ncbi:glycosyltransferase family 4 protein [Paenibacillus herberti]|uniref:Glycosyl transferase family 1 n=1 Tax=Paenibacillus herberti TaxID=1619309 RepID=A0A229P674_9BACL|nr:glycosyltransferase family 4 protein [Paenibacillus herberti]OXM17587.1 glycosyl transferase family 1 [Paenibacillus herberti]